MEIGTKVKHRYDTNLHRDTHGKQITGEVTEIIDRDVNEYNVIVRWLQEPMQKTAAFPIGNYKEKDLVEVPILLGEAE